MRFLRLFTGVVAILGFAAGVILLLSDLFFPLFPHAPISAAPLIFIGTANLAFLIVIRPNPLNLFKALIVSLAFILWGIYQLLPSGWSTTTLGDIVIVLYVLDLGWMLMDSLKTSRKENAHPL